MKALINVSLPQKHKDMKIVKFGFSLFGINTYVVVDPTTGKCAIVDPGMIDPEEENALADYIKRNEYQVTHVINTHLHIDHVAGNHFAIERFHVPVLAHQDDESLGERIDLQVAQFGMSEKIDNVTISTYLHEGDTIEIGEGRLEVLHVPGHSQGSVALYDRKGGFVIVGDALFAGSIGRTDLPGGSYPQLIDSIKSKLMSLPDSTVVYPGHGHATTIGIERQSNPFLR